ncbi:MAG: hypothetical protein QF898_01990 [SAR202 cluster bacterium]|nr:hypothetical protein [SAR202 cluster bacterium]MDP6512316.1 hypothetical protein [SAR202 cluster bacterium]MDP6713092.1 hypothetical protein [SAR202 cluster bacterium]
MQNPDLFESHTNMPFADGPYLQAATICERVLVEQDGVKSVIRMIDRITANAVGPNVPEVMNPLTREIDLLLRFKSGSARGVYSIQIRIQKPSGESPEPMTQTVNFEGESDRGVDLIAQLVVQFEIPGLYWFDIYLENIRITRIPLRIIYLPQPTQSGAQLGD